MLTRSRRARLTNSHQFNVPPAPEGCAIAQEARARIYRRVVAVKAEHAHRRSVCPVEETGQGIQTLIHTDNGGSRRKAFGAEGAIAFTQLPLQFRNPLLSV